MKVTITSDVIWGALQHQDESYYVIVIIKIQSTSLAVYEWHISFLLEAFFICCDLNVKSLTLTKLRWSYRWKYSVVLLRETHYRDTEVIS